MKKKVFAAILALIIPAAALSCVGKSLVVGTDSTPESKVVAQVLAILINERTGTTVQIIDHDTPEALFKEMRDGDVDIALQYAGSALKRAGKEAGGDASTTYDLAKDHYQSAWNLVWLPPLGFSETGDANSLAAPVAQKHALKKFPALPRLIAKTKDVLPAAKIEELSSADSIPRAVREFLKDSKLI
ncbi:MAG: hypothetical protein C0609_00640 [Deltaproteobacteria bacterium]|nr:MAG: hypothetical protein C0609_00640 [Deltaproteobacteria bacterium]